MKTKECVILRGVPGCGKSTLAEILIGEVGKRFEADDYCYNKEGVYEFVPANIKANHQNCYDDFVGAIDDGVSPVVVSNTSTELWQYKRYMEYAANAGYKVTVTVVENYHGGKSIHNVPEETLDNMREKLTKSITL